MLRWQALILWILGIGCLLAMMSFGARKAEQTRLSQVRVHINHGPHGYFVQRDDVLEIVENEHPFIDSLQLSEINISLLEERLDNHPSILKAEVYSNLLGQVQIDVEQKKPLARIMGKGGSYYLTHQGDSMQLSKNYSAPVPLLTGEINRKSRAEAFAFISQTEEDDFYRNFFAGININPNGNWVLYPKLGQHKVELGIYEAQAVHKKLEKLKTFYQTVLDEDMLHKLKRINLEYQGQVVCEKHKN